MPRPINEPLSVRRNRPNYAFLFFWPAYIIGVIVLGSFLLRAVNWTRGVDATIARMVAGGN